MYKTNMKIWSICKYIHILRYSRQLPDSNIEYASTVDMPFPVKSVIQNMESTIEGCSQQTKHNWPKRSSNPVSEFTVDFIVKHSRSNYHNSHQTECTAGYSPQFDGKDIKHNKIGFFFACMGFSV